MDATALWYFECVNLYKILCPHKVKDIGNKHEFKTFKKGEFVYLNEEISTHIYLIADGRIKIGNYLSDGKEVVKSILIKGEIFGELAVAGEDTRKDFAKAVTETTVCLLSLQDLQQLMYNDRDLSFKILKLVGLRLRKIERKLELLVFKDARTRVIEFLKDAATWKGNKAGYETIIYTRLTHQEIASLIGTSRQTVTTILNELQENKLIKFDRRRFIINDINRLR
ncbi:MAG: Crp/Fnr family transcriptional regulator [Cyclobacteriaceae bacterium]|nr:Crp/Fnr family transcriptional regulator [Cyclobacteriaceae bacterium]